MDASISFFSVNNLLTAIIALFMIFLNFRFTSMKEQVDALKKEVDEIKKENAEIRKNYLNRFDDMKETMYSVKEEIMNRLQEIDIKVEKQNAYCQTVQETKKIKSRIK